MSTATEHCHIVRETQVLGGEPVIKGTRTPVRAIVELYRMGLDPAEIPQRLPHLSLGQVFDALSFYSDHQQEIDEHIQRNQIPEELIDPLVKNA
jgi:uncharacterized protein (DUF433 family)